MARLRLAALCISSVVHREGDAVATSPSGCYLRSIWEMHKDGSAAPRRVVHQFCGASGRRRRGGMAVVTRLLPPAMRDA